MNRLVSRIRLSLPLVVSSRPLQQHSIDSRIHSPIIRQQKTGRQATAARKAKPPVPKPNLLSRDRSAPSLNQSSSTSAPPASIFISNLFSASTRERFGLLYFPLLDSRLHPTCNASSPRYQYLSRTWSDNFSSSFLLICLFHCQTSIFCPKSSSACGIPDIANTSPLKYNNFSRDFSQLLIC